MPVMCYRSLKDLQDQSNLNMSLNRWSAVALLYIGSGQQDPERKGKLPSIMAFTPFVKQNYSCFFDLIQYLPIRIRG